MKTKPRMITITKPTACGKSITGELAQPSAADHATAFYLAVIKTVANQIWERSHRGR